MWKKLTTFGITLLLVLLVFYTIRDGAKDILNTLLGVLSPVLLGFLFAYILNHLVSFFKKFLFLIRVRGRKLQNFFAVVLSIVSVLLLLGIMILFLIPALNSIILEGVDGFLEKIKTSLAEIDALLGLGENFSLSSLMVDIDATIINDYLNNFLKGIPDVLSTIGISFVIAVTFLLEKDKVVTTLKNFADKIFSHPEKVKNGCGCAIVILDGYMVSKIIEASLTGVVFGVICAIFGVPFSVLLGILMGLFFTVPYVGGYFALIPAFMFGITVSPIVGLIIVLIGVVLINVVGTFISPMLFKNNLKISPLTTLVSTIIGGGVFGIWGFLLAPPIIAIVKVYISVFVKSRQIPR